MTITRQRDQATRRPELLRLLRENGPLTNAELAQYLGCQTQTIERDIRFFKDHGYDIKSTEKRPVLHTLIETPDTATLDPVKAIIQHALQRLLHHHAPTPSRVYYQALAELSAHLPTRLREISEKTLTTPIGSTPRILETIAAAWCYAQPIRFTYQKPSRSPETGEAHVIYMEVNRTNLDWYVFLQRKGETKIKTFHLSRFHEVTRLQDQTSPDIPFDPRQELDGTWGIIGGDRHCDITLKFDPQAVPYVTHRTWPGQLEARMDGQHYVLKVRAPLNNDHLPVEVLAWIRSWGPRVELVSPPHLRELWLAEAKAIVDRHGS